MRTSSLGRSSIAAIAAGDSTTGSSLGAGASAGGGVMSGVARGSGSGAVMRISSGGPAVQHGRRLNGELVLRGLADGAANRLITVDQGAARLVRRVRHRARGGHGPHLDRGHGAAEREDDAGGGRR